MQKLQLAVMPWHVGQRAGQMTCGAAPGTSQPRVSAIGCAAERSRQMQGIEYWVLGIGGWFRMIG